MLNVFRVLLVLNSLFLPNTSTVNRCSLTHAVNAFVAPRQSRLASLRDFARQNRLSFGIESASSLGEQVPISASAGSVVSVVSVILGPAGKPSLRCLEGVVLIREQRAAKSPSWLDRTVPDFQSDRSPLGLANTLYGCAWNFCSIRSGKVSRETFQAALERT